MSRYPSGTAAAQGLAACDACETLTSVADSARCRVCRTKLHLRKPQSLQRCLAFLTTAFVLYIPASVLPIMATEQLGRTTQNTIAGGVLLLWHHGSYPIAVVIFVASVLVPMAKMFAIGWLCWVVGRGDVGDRTRLAKLYEVTEIVGKWSMVDVFVVALLVALIQVGSVLNIRPGPAALAFAGVVILTMLSAHSFDPRIIWDQEEKHERS